MLVPNKALWPTLCLHIFTGVSDTQRARQLGNSWKLLLTQNLSLLLYSWSSCNIPQLWPGGYHRNPKSCCDIELSFWKLKTTGLLSVAIDYRQCSFRPLNFFPLGWFPPQSYVTLHSSLWGSSMMGNWGGRSYKEDLGEKSLPITVFLVVACVA